MNFPKAEIHSAEEFVLMAHDRGPEASAASAYVVADEAVWWDIIERFPEMIAWVINAKFVPITVLEHFAKSADADLRSRVAFKRKLSVELFQLLSQDENESVRQRIAINRKTPLSILDVLVSDPSKDVREWAMRRRNERLTRTGQAAPDVSPPEDG